MLLLSICHHRPPIVIFEPKFEERSSNNSIFTTLGRLFFLFRGTATGLSRLRSTPLFLAVRLKHCCADRFSTLYVRELLDCLPTSLSRFPDHPTHSCVSSFGTEYRTEHEPKPIDNLIFHNTALRTPPPFLRRQAA